MAFYTDKNLIQGTPLTLDDTEVSFMDYLKAAAGDAWADNPTVALKRLGDVYTAQVGEDTVVDLAMSNDLSVDLDSYEPTAGPELSMDEQADIIKTAGLETHLKPQKGYNREALDIIMGRKREELDRAMTREQAPAWMAPFGFAAGLVTSFADPINLASNFIPVVGEQRVLRLLQQARTPMGRAAVRAGIGAAEGAVGAAVVEPLVYLSRTQEQADYDMTDSLLNVAFGAIMGGAMHSATGAIGDWVRSRRGQRQPWEVKAPTDQSELRRTQFADELFSASQEAGASITREQADATAVLFDARARTWAYDEGKDAVEYYDTWKPDFRAAVETLKAEADLEQGMQRSQRLVLDEFKADARAGAIEYFVPEETPDAMRAALEVDDLITNLPSNYMRHLDNNHPKMADALFADTTRILKNADQVVAVGRTREGAPKYAAVLHEGDEATVVVVAASRSKKKGNRVSPITAYKNSAEVIDAVVNKHSRAARSTDAGSDPSLLKPLNEDEVRAFATLEESMADEVREVKRPVQQMQEAIARESAGPDVTDPAMGPATLYQWQNLPEWEERTTAWMRNDGRSEEEISKYLAAVRGQMAIYEALGPKIMDQVVGAGQATRTKRNFGVAYSGPVRSNADEIYMVSFDASSQCVKRLGAAKTAQMAEQMLGRPLQVDEQMALIALYRAAGKEAPCLYCYVESNRRKATAAVGTAREVIISGEIPKSWGKDRKAAAQAAIDLAKAEGLTLDDIEFDYILDPRKGSTPEAIEAKERHKPIYDFLNSEALATKQNQVKLYEEYRGELLDITPEQIEALNGYAGLRFFSSSDFQVEHVVDLIQSFWDMKALGAKSHAYTKVPLYVDIFGETGQKINMSIFAEVDKDGNIRPDLQQGWDWQAAKAQREKHPDVGTIIVTANDKILKWALEQDWIDYCIPFHYSGLEKKYYTTMEWQDFTATQVERLVYPGKTTKDKPIYPVDVPRVRMHEMGTMDGISNEQGTRNYLELCLERKLYPVFTDFLFKDFQVAADAKARTAQVKEAKARWKAMVDKGEIDWDQINPNFFKVKKDYARTDTAFRVVEPEKIDTVAAEQPLRETLDKGLDAKYAGDEDIARAIVELSEYGRLNNVAIGPRALEASKRRQDIRSAIMGTEAQPTNYIEADPNVLWQTAYHGTPHNFDAFSLQAIGSGEGAQAHGWGLYFAEDQDVSERYRQVLLSGQRTSALSPYMWFDEVREYVDGNASLDDTVRALKEFIQEVEQEDLSLLEVDEAEVYAQELEAARESLRIIEESPSPDEEFVNKQRGQLFEVEIPDNDVLLDEQKPFEDQPPLVRGALRKMVETLTDEQMEDFGQDVHRIGRKKAAANIIKLFDGIDGRKIYSTLVGVFGSPREASEALNSVGIKGITYDGRQDGRCFVVFDDQAIQILDKLYQEQASYAAGATTPLEEGYFIQLFKGANLSTLSHELTHAMYLEMERLEREGMADARMLEDLATIRNWTAHMDDDANLKAEYDKRIRPRSDFGMEFDQLTPEMKAIARAIAKHEMVARGFEQYLREGNAPTPKLEGVFRRFAKWLKRVYKTALMLDVELNDEVRDVFDRWMASDEDIQATAVNANIRDESGTVLDSLGVQGADRLELEHLIHEAKEKASDALRRDRAAKLRESVKAWREEAEAEVAADPVYAAREAMRREPLDLDAIVDAYGQDAAAKLMKKVPASLKKGGANPEALAFDYGFRNAGEMLKAIDQKPGKRERIQEIVKQKREDADAQFSAEDYLFEQDALADQQEKIGEILYRLELEGKTQGGKPVQPEQQDYEDFKSHARALRAVGREQIKTVAEKHLDELEVAKAIRPDLFRAAAARLMREERAAILAKDWRAAMEANYKARLNIELARQAAQRRDIMESLTSKAKRFLKSKETDVNARFAIFVLSQNIQLFPATMKMLADAGDKTIANVRQFLNEMKEAGYYTIDAEIDESLFTGGAAAWRAMRWGKGLQPYVDAMTTIMHMERESRKANSEAAKQSWNEQMDALEASIRAFYPNAPASPSAQHESGLLHWLKKFHSEHLKADTIALTLDGDRSFGPAWEAIVRPINQATWKKTERMREESRRLKELFGAYSHNELMHMKGDRVFIDAIGEPLTKEQMIACALNCGNEENMQRLMDGFNWNRDQLQAILDMLDERDWRFVQGVWDYLESFRKESFDLEEKLSGVRPKAIAAKPLQTKYGTLRGGYYPAVYDPRKTSRAIDPESVGTQTSGTNAVVDHGSMKQRTATGLKAPLKLDLGVIPSHVEKTVHMLAFREPVRSVGRVLNDRRVNNAIQSALGVEVANALGDWLKYVAGERPARSSIGDVAGWMRKNSALFTMGFKLSTMLMQVTGYLTTIAELGPKWSSIGVMKVYGSGSPLAAYNMAMELSPMMRTRMQSIDRDVFEASTKLLEEGSRYPVADQLLRFRAMAEKYAFKGMGVVQMFAADLPTWHGAFAKGMEEWNDKQKAAEYADMVVERTQVGGADKDLAGMQTGGKYGELGKLATQFYSYFSALYQLFTRRTNALKRSDWKGPAEWWRLGTLAMLTWCVEPALQSLMPNSGPDDDEEWLRWWGREVAFQPFNMVIGVRDVANMYKSRMEGYSGSFRPSPSLDTFNAIGRFSDQIVNLFQGEGDTKKLALSGGKALGLTTGLVNAQELLILEEFWDWLDGTNPDFELADLIRRKKK